ncbi:MAG: Clp protease N-terminal domain-containing protein [Nocardioidaceae bacterium]
MFERFSTEARQTVIRASARTRARGGDLVTSTDLLQALAEPGSPVAAVLSGHGLGPETLPAREGDAEALRSIGIDLDAIREAVEASFGAGAMDRPASGQGRDPRFARGAKKALELSLRETIRLRTRSIRSAALALGVLRADDPDVGRWLARQGVDIDTLRGELEQLAREAA